ncbi:MAG: hypothetical protein ACLQJR_26960 [Stellaceae bacterium]
MVEPAAAAVTAPPPSPSPVEEMPPVPPVPEAGDLFVGKGGASVTGFRPSYWSYDRAASGGALPALAPGQEGDGSRPRSHGRNQDTAEENPIGPEPVALRAAEDAATSSTGEKQTQRARIVPPQPFADEAEIPAPASVSYDEFLDAEAPLPRHLANAPAAQPVSARPAPAMLVSAIFEVSETAASAQPQSAEPEPRSPPSDEHDAPEVAEPATSEATTVPLGPERRARAAAPEPLDEAAVARLLLPIGISGEIAPALCDPITAMALPDKAAASRDSSAQPLPQGDPAEAQAAVAGFDAAAAPRDDEAATEPADTQAPLAPGDDTQSPSAQTLDTAEPVPSPPVEDDGLPATSDAATPEAEGQESVEGLSDGEIEPDDRGRSPVATAEAVDLSPAIAAPEAASAATEPVEPIDEAAAVQGRESASAPADRENAPRAFAAASAEEAPFAAVVADAPSARETEGDGANVALARAPVPDVAEAQPPVPALDSAATSLPVEEPAPVQLRPALDPAPPAAAPARPRAVETEDADAANEPVTDALGEAIESVLSARWYGAPQGAPYTRPGASPIAATRSVTPNSLLEDLAVARQELQPPPEAPASNRKPVFIALGVAALVGTVGYILSHSHLPIGGLLRDITRLVS